MTATEYFESQANFNKWLKELTLAEQLQIIQMMGEFAVIQIEDCQNYIEQNFANKNFVDGLE